MKQEIRFCTTSDEVKIAYANIGNGSILVKAANWLSHLEYDLQSPVWQHWIKELSRHNTLIRYDERGCGLSDWNIDSFSFGTWVNDLETVVDTLKLDNFPLLGISQGGAVAIAYAVRHPERVSHLILYGTYAQGRLRRNFSPNETEQHNALTTLIKIGWGQDSSAFRQVFANLFMPEASAELLRSFAELQRISVSPQNAMRFHEEFGKIDVLELLPRINIPTLVLHSNNDGRIPLDAGRQLAALIPNAKFVLLESKNHILLETEPAWQHFLKEVYGFLGINVETDIIPSANKNYNINKPVNEISKEQIITHYKILERLGSGGMGIVYKAEDLKLKRFTALKFLPVELTKDPEAKERFIQEAQAASGLDHPNICTIYEIDETDDSQLFMAMACYEGETLRKKIEPSPLKLEEALDIAVQAANGLEAAHKAGMIHRDIKPANIMITDRGEAKILDFGLAKMIGKSNLTQKNTFLGTISYISPEQAIGETIDHRTDIWSLGITIYEMISGRVPFKGEYEQAVIYSIINEKHIPLTSLRTGVPVELDHIIDKALAKNPAERYQHISDLIVDLKRTKKLLEQGGNSLLSESDSSVLTMGKDYRRLSAIMFTDVVGYSALVQKNEALALELLQEHRVLLRQIFPKHSGKEIETAGDSFFVEFASTLEAAKCAIEIQSALHERNTNVPEDKKIIIRIGLHVGDVVHIGKHVHGDGVNLAARMEPLASPGGICLSEDVARQIQNKIDLPILKLGKGNLKNIKLPVDVYQVVLPWEKKKINISDRFNFRRPLKKASLILIPIILVALILYLFLLQRSNGTITSNSQNRIAVLPFINISSDQEDEYFAEGMTEEIISNLAKISGLDVIARTSIMKYKNTNLNVAQIGNELNVGTILEGSVRTAANTARITVQLIEASTQRHLWSEDYDRELKDIFAIQSDIAMKVAEELKIQLVANEKEQIGKKGTENTDAYRNYLLGNYFLNRRTGEDLKKGIEYFNKAIEFDPAFPHAYAGLANCYTLIGGAAYGMLSRDEASLKAKDAVLKSLELDENLAEAHASLGYIKFRIDWNWDEAEKEFRKAIELKPGYAQAHEWYALFLALIRKSSKALNEMNRAYELDPLSPSISTGVGRILHFMSKEDEAIAQFKKTIEMYPNYAEGHFGLAVSYLVKKNFNESLKEIDRAIELSQRRPVIIGIRGMIYGLMGNRKESLAILEELEKLSGPDAVSPIIISNLYIGLGNLDKALELFEKAYEIKDPFMVYIQSESAYGFYKQLYSHPRYIEILKKMKFAD